MSSNSSIVNTEDKSKVTVKTYFKQSDAIEDAYNSNEPKNVFSFEIDLQGRRKYLVTTIENFYRFYSKMNTRNYYEVIPKQSFAKLYFDIEFKKDCNSDRNGYKMTRYFVKKVNEILFNEYKIRNKFQDVLILESSSSCKFSIHLIFPEVIFLNNECCGSFVKRMIQNFSEEDQRNFEIVQNNRKCNFVDMSVYSKNRNLRLYKSMKMGKSIPFLVSQTYNYLTGATEAKAL